MFNSDIKIDKNIIIIISLILFAIALRLLPHPPNFSPIGAIGLFAGCYLSLKRFWIIPIVALFVSDFVLGFYHPISMLSVYLSFGISALLGSFFLKDKITPFRITGTAIFSATQFFILSNLGVWISGLIYPMNITGLISCYVMAIPFYGNTLLSELFYAFILFGTYYFLTNFVKKGNTHNTKSI